MADLAASWPRAVVFDLDGTLVDSAPDIRIAINRAFAPLGVPPFSLDDVKSMIGGGAPAAISRAAALAGIGLGPAGERAALDLFYPVYAEQSAKGQGLFNGARELLDHLAALGLPLAICTNKAQPITEIALDALDIRQHFRAVVGARDGLPKKPDPAPVLAALAGLRTSPGAAVMIGDTAADIGAAKAAGVASIAIAHGYSRRPVSELGADHVVASLAEVPDAIDTLRRARS